MLQRRLLTACLALAFVAVPAFTRGTQEKAKLAWKFEKDKTFYQKLSTVTQQSLKVLNNDVVQKQSQTFYFSWTPEKQDGDTWIVKQKIEAVQMDIDIGGSKISYDSSKAAADASNPLGEFFKNLVGSEFRLTISLKPDAVKVTKIEGRDDFLKKLTGANPQMKPLLEQILSETALKEMAEPTFAVVPQREVAVGEKWTKESTLDMGPIGKYENKYTYTYEGKNKDAKDPKAQKLDKIKVETALKYVAPTEGAGGVASLPFKIKSAELTASDAKGSVLFDSEAGRVDSSTMHLELKGKLSIEIGGQTTQVELSQTQDTNVKGIEATDLPKKP
jgi:hypothetical protein